MENDVRKKGLNNYWEYLLIFFLMIADFMQILFCINKSRIFLYNCLRDLQLDRSFKIIFNINFQLSTIKNRSKYLYDHNFSRLKAH